MSRDGVWQDKVHGSAENNIFGITHRDFLMIYLTSLCARAYQHLNYKCLAVIATLLVYSKILVHGEKMETVEADETRDSPVEIEVSSSQSSISTVGNAPQELSAISKLVRLQNG